MLRHSLCLGYCLSINITWLAGKYCLSNKPQDEKESTVLFNCKWSFTRKFLITFAFSLELRNWSVGDRESYDVASSWASLDPACHRAGIPTPKMSLGPHLKRALDFVHSLHWQGFLWVCFRLWCPFFSSMERGVHWSLFSVNSFSCIFVHPVCNLKESDYSSPPQKVAQW